MTGQTCACGAPGQIFIEASKTWICGPCILAGHDQLEAKKAAAQSWPPETAGRDFGPGSAVIANPGGLLDRILSDRGAIPG